MKRGVVILIVLAVLIVIVGFFFLNSEPQSSNKDSSSNQIFDFQSAALGELCSGEECIEFCLDNRARCESYCRGNYENELCPVIFPPTEAETERKDYQPEKEGCEGTKTKFDFAPVNLAETKVFLPLGLMTGSHVTPIDHHYFQNFDNEGYDIEIYSPGKGIITHIGHMPGAVNGEDYRVVIQHTCTIQSIYIHLGTFVDKFMKYASDNNGFVSVKIPVEAGELLGYYERNVDYNLVDEEITLEGFVTPELYIGEPWKLHVPNTYDYFNEPVRSELIAKSLRTAEPISGKIDYDIDGKLVGNWFLEGTGGYAGKSTSREGYWLNHLAIAYDTYDPDRIVFSVAGYEGQDSRQFGIKGNSPDPADISVENGLVKFELVDYDYIKVDGTIWDRKSLAGDLKTTSNEVVRGVVLVQMVSDRKIKFEVFPGKTASQVEGFTENVGMYER